MEDFQTVTEYDFIVIGAGAAGLPCALFGALAGARVLLVEKGAEIGGSLRVSGGPVAAAGTRIQKERGIEDSIDAHFKDILRVSQETVRKDLVRLAAQHAAEFVDWLEAEGFEFAPGTPGLAPGDASGAVARTHRGVDGGRSILKVLARRIEPLTASGALTLVLEAPVKALLTEAGRVVGIQFAKSGTVERARARRGVVLATGGFAASPELFREIEGVPLFSAAPPHARGDGLLMARGLGAQIAGQGQYLPIFAGLPDPHDPHRVASEARPLLAAPERPPGEIYVDRFGKRWVAEDEESLDLKARALLRIDGLTFFAVFDDQAADLSPGIIAGWSADELRRHAGHREGVYVADTPEALAAAAGIDDEGLALTVARYNGFVRGKRDPDLGRRFLPAPIEKAPFYALRLHGASRVSYSGVDVNESFRVRREDRSVIEGLYAAGEVLGAGAICGNTLAGDSLIGPAMIFGRLIGERLARPADSSSDATIEIRRPRS